MSKLRVHSFSISLDGYGAGPNQGLENPLGSGGESLHDWIVVTRTFQELYGAGGGETGVDNDFTARGFARGTPLRSAARAFARSRRDGDLWR